MLKLARASMGYTVGGLLGGFYYRELTRHRHYPAGEPTQLRVFHTHSFALGTIFFLIVLLLEKNFALSRQKNYKRFYITYNIGLGITLLMLLIHGTITVIGKERKTRWITWSAGVGHVFLTLGFGCFYDVLMKAVKAATPPLKPEDATQ